MQVEKVVIQQHVKMRKRKEQELQTLHFLKYVKE
jgi:hypothetical protein